MDPAAAANETTDALRSALDAARRERDALSSRIDEVDRLIDDLAQAAEDSAAAPDRHRAPGTGTARKTPGGQRTSKAATKKAGARGRGAAGRKAGKKATARGGKRTTRQQPGRTDRVVTLVNEADEPLTTAQVRSGLAAHEPDVSSQVVSASLSYAQRKGRIRRTEDGRWGGVTAG